MAEHPFWQQAVDSWDWGTLRAFLEEDLPEGLHLEYKEPRHHPQKGHWQVSSDVVETIVAMANTTDGLLLLGVAERADKHPGAIVGINHTRPEKCLRDHCASAIEPIVALEIRVIAIPEGAPDAGRSVMVVRVRRGPNPPYLQRGRGVFMREGDHDRPATVRDLQALFERRGESLAPATGPWGRVNTRVFQYLGMIDRELPPVVAVGLTPVFPITPAALSLEADVVFSDIVRTGLGIHTDPFLEPDGVSYIAQPKDPPPERIAAAMALASGDIGLRRSVTYETAAAGHRQVDVEVVWRHFSRLLTAASTWTRGICGVAGPLHYVLALGNIPDTILVIDERLVEAEAAPLARYVPQRLNQQPYWMTSGEWDEGQDVNDLIEPALAGLARQLQCRAFAARARGMLRTTVEQKRDQ